MVRKTEIKVFISFQNAGTLIGSFLLLCFVIMRGVHTLLTISLAVILFIIHIRIDLPYCPAYSAYPTTTTIVCMYTK